MAGKNFSIVTLLLLIIGNGWFEKEASAHVHRIESDHPLPTVGAIRWDAWYDMPIGVYPWVAASMSDKRFNDRLPFFATILQNDSVKMDNKPQEVMDSEIHYAKYAGLDYWAFVTYHEKEMLSWGLKTYLNSKFRSAINFCLITEQERFWNNRENRIDERYVQRVVDLMCEKGYQTVLAGRPLWYLGFINEATVKKQWGTLSNFKMLIDRIRQSVVDRGLKNPYLVIMDFDPVSASSLCDSVGADAISTYMSQKGSKQAPFRQLAAETRAYWDDFAATGKQVVPNWMAGWNPEPRIVTPVPWLKYPDSVYYTHATRNELAQHFENGIDWLSDNRDRAKANTAIIYAWNEFDEGGWLCPTRDVKTGLPDMWRICELRSALKRNNDSADRLLIQDSWERSMVNPSKAITTSIFNVMKRAERGDTVTIGVIGGSVTQGAFATNEQNRYGGQILTWWKKEFPAAQFRLVNAGIGATSSLFGVHRIDTDLLAYNPDLVVIEFAVNDFGVRYVPEAYEGMIRKILKKNPNTAVVSLSLMDSTGNNCQLIHQPICDYYHIPMISYRDAMWPEIVSGKMPWSSLSPDQVHPNDRGHRIVADLVTELFERVRREKRDGQQAVFPVDPLTSDIFENSQVMAAESFRTEATGDWRYDAESQGWITRTKGKPLRLTIKGKQLQVMYQRKAGGKGARGYVVVNGKEKIQLQGDFDDGWGDYADLIPLVSQNENTPVKLEFYCDDNRPGRALEITRILVAF